MTAPTAKIDTRFSDPWLARRRVPTLQTWSSAPSCIGSPRCAPTASRRCPLIGVADGPVAQFCTGLDEQKARNLEHNAQVALVAAV